MCGLIAILDRHAGGWDRVSAESAVERGLKFLEHRGLLGRSAIVERGGATLGHVRLPIIDLSTNWDQPINVGDSTLAFVGEIFNFQELDPRATCDTQVVGDRFFRFGPPGFHAFDGFWSVVFADRHRATVLTDYLSQKPLYFHRDSLMVASEPLAISAALERPLAPDPVFFANVLKWGYDPTGRTPFAGVVQLPAGHALIYDQGLSLEPYWDWQRVPYDGDLAGVLIEATRRRLIGDREVALLLSGGLDSTIIFRILVEVLGENVKVFHAANNEDEFLELALAGHQSRPLRTPAVPIEDAVVAHQVPVDLGSMVPQLALAKALRDEGFYVCMSGDGADELFGGYRRAKEYDSQASDVFTELPYYHLPRLDRLMMAATVELRTPFLSPKVVRHAMQIPWAKRTSKQALKEVFGGLVPQEIIEREKHPLKTPDVINGGVEYRKQLIETWHRRIGLWSLR